MRASMWRLLTALQGGPRSRQQGTHVQRGGYEHFNPRGGPERRHLLIALVGGAGALTLYATNKQTIPYTSRRHLILVSKEFEQRLGTQQFRMIQRQHARDLLPAAHPLSRQVVEVGRRLRAVLEAGCGGGGYTDHLQHLDWEFAVIDSPQVNAFVLPGGKMVVFTGLLAAMRSQGELAAVIAHEVAHVVARHHAERITQSGLISSVQVVAMAMFGFHIPRDLFSLVFELPHSRLAEIEADAIGLKLMARACYWPESALGMMRTLSRLERGAGGGMRPPELLSTHPQSSERLERLSAALPAAVEMYNDSGCRHRTRDMKEVLAF